MIAPDLLGHGELAKPRGDYSLGAYANAVRDLLGALGEARGTIVGHSLGGGVAMQFAYQFPERCERLVLVSSGGLGREVHPLLRAAALPGAELVLPWLCAAGAAASAQHRAGARPRRLRASADLEEIWRSFASLEEPDARQAFLHTVRGIIDLGGQRVSATDRLYLAGALPTLIVWGERDPLIPVRHAHEATRAFRAAGSRSSRAPATSPTATTRSASRRSCSTSSQTTAPMAVDEQQWRSRLRTAGQSTAAAL